MIEYLYIDMRRLDNYFEQISSPVIYDKVPTWNVELSLVGPKAAGAQTRLGRVPTKYEKIQQFVSYISKEIVRERLLPWDRGKLESSFFQATMSARRVQIEHGGNFLNIWISMPSSAALEEHHGQTEAYYLIEDFKGDESQINTVSGASSLYLLAGELEWAANPTKTNEPIAKLCEKDDATRLFARDPIGTLVSLGGKIGLERRITTIYRFRASCIEMEGQYGRARTIIGYPIFIQEGD